MRGFQRLCVAVPLLLLALSIAPANAGETLSPATISPTELLHRVRSAQGELARGAYHIAMRGVVDGDVSVEDTFVDSRGYKTTETASGFTSSWGEFQRQAWYQDANGF